MKRLYSILEVTDLKGDRIKIKDFRYDPAFYGDPKVLLTSRYTATGEVIWEKPKPKKEKPEPEPEPEVERFIDEVTGKEYKTEPALKAGITRRRKKDLEKLQLVN